jgi:hypothetical protein
MPVVRFAVSKRNQMRLESEPHNSSRLAFAAHVVNALNKLAKRQIFFPAMGFHASNTKPRTLMCDMGCSPHTDLFPDSAN